MRFLFIALLLPTLAFAHPTAQVRYSDLDGKVQIQTFGGATESTPFALASIGKMMTSAAVLRHVERGQINLDALASSYLDRDLVAALPSIEGVTIRHMLTMTSGMPDYLPDFFGDMTAREAVMLIAGKRRKFRPGQRYDYSNTN